MRKRTHQSTTPKTSRLLGGATQGRNTATAVQKTSEDSNGVQVWDSPVGASSDKAGRQLDVTFD